MGSTKMKLPSYLLPSNVTFDPGSGEMYYVQNSYKSNNDIAERLSRNTESSNSKLYKWQRKGSPSWRKAVVINKHPTFETVSKERAKSIAERLSRPTESTRVRSAWDTDSECGSIPPTRTRNLSAASRTSGASRASSLRLPRPSARPDKPILVFPSAKEKREKNESPVRNVRFQSPLPQMETQSRLSRYSSAGTRSDIIPPIPKSQPSTKPNSKRQNSAETDQQYPSVNTNVSMSSKSSLKTEVSDRKSSASSDKSSTSSEISPRDTSQQSEKKNKQPTSSEVHDDTVSNKTDQDSSVPKTEELSVTPSNREAESSSPAEDAESDDIPNDMQSKSPDNKNMELVLDYFSQM